MLMLLKIMFIVGLFLIIMVLYKNKKNLKENKVENLNDGDLFKMGILLLFVPVLLKLLSMLGSMIL